MHEKVFARRTIPLVTISLAVFDLLFLYAMRSAWSGIAERTGIDYLPYLLVALLVVVIAAAIALAALMPLKAAIWPLFGLSAALFAALVYVLSQAIGSWTYILREFFYGVSALGIVALVAFFMLLCAKTKLASNSSFQALTLLVVLVAFFVLAFDLRINAFVEGPVVYAVGDEYQVVFTTRARSRAWVEAGGREFHDSYAGSDISETRVHKVRVPMAVMDASSVYRVRARAMLLRLPYSALQGRTIGGPHRWRPLDDSDGIQFYAISDTHEFTKPAIEAARFFGDKLDFLVLNGDIVSFLDREEDLEKVLRIAEVVTHGERPVVFARGNHEVKGVASNRLHRYVGAEGENFFYSFRLGPVWGMVLDLGEDHADDWWEFFGSARFDGYRAEQTAFMDGLIARAEEEYLAPGVEHRVAIAHIPVTFAYESDYAADVKRLWAERLNQMRLDFMVNGHRHQAMYVSLDLPALSPLRQKAAFTGSGDSEKTDGYRTASNFPAFIGSRRSLVQSPAVKEDLFGRRIFGMAFDLQGEDISVRYTNSKGEVLRTVGPWTGEDYGELIRIKSFAARER